jgi:MFS transporter, FSR family, fosmidomycin resistance protein
MLLAALAVELVDELLDGTKSAAMPLIRHSLSLSYLQVGLLAAVPLIVGSVIELPIGVLSGSGTRRRTIILAGGLVFIASVVAAGLAGTFAALLVALTIFFPASGAFVSLTQSALMDSDPVRQPQYMARWTLAGSVGAVLGPLLVAAVLAGGGSWRLAFVLVAAASGLAWLAEASAGTGAPGGGSAVGSEPDEDSVDLGRADLGSADPGTADLGRADLGSADPGSADLDSADRGSGWPGWRAAVEITRQSGALRWLLLLQVSDLLLDVFTAFLALYLVDQAHATPSEAALCVAVRLGAGLAGDAMLIWLLEHRDSQAVLRVSGWLSLMLLPAFLLAPGLGLKLVLLAALTLATAPWYPVLKAGLFGSLPGRSGLAVSLDSAAGLAGGLGPIVIGLLAERFGLGWAMASMCLVPPLLLAILPARKGR